MPRYRRREVVYRPPREERIIIYATKEHKKLWEKMVIDMEVRNYEDALIKLLTLYSLAAELLQEKRIDELIKKLGDALGATTQFRVVRPP